jgi:hypothetical protein
VKRGAQSLVYPPAGWAVMAPFSVVGAKWLLPVWLATNVALWLVTIAGAVVVASLSWRDARSWLLVGLGLGAAHTSLMLGQTAVLITALVVWGQALRGRGRPIAGGALMGVAAVIKPQLAALFVVYEAGRRRPVVVSAAVAAGILAMLVGVLRPGVGGRRLVGPVADEPAGVRGGGRGRCDGA